MMGGFGVGLVAFIVTFTTLFGLRETASFGLQHIDATTNPELCANHTNIVVDSIKTARTVNATSSVIAAEETCTVGYNWDGRSCVKSIVTASHCEENFEMVDGRCELIENAECPAGYHQSEESGQCVIRVEFRVKCPPEHEWNGDNCVHSVPSCRSGYALLNGQCVKTVSGECPLGTEMQDGICVQTRTASATCPYGFELIGTQCKQTKQPQCDTSSTGQQLVNGNCVAVESEPAIYKCPANMRLEGKQCVSIVQRCPHGYVLNGTTCVNVTIVCPPNSTLDANNQCVRTICLPVPAGCPTGYELINGKCYLIKSPPITCTNGLILVNGTRCVRPCELIEAFCPNYFVLSDGWCVNTTGALPVRPYCTSGYDLQNSWCVLSNSYPNCTVVQPQCPPGYLWQNNHCVRSIDCTNGYYWLENKCVPRCAVDTVWNGVVCSPIQGPIETECLPGLTYINGSCIPVHTKPGCGPNYVLVDSWCIPINSTTPTPICPDGYYFHNGTCHQIGVAPICPKGYWFVNNECVCNSTGPTVPIKDQNPCPPDRPNKLANGTCVWIEVVTERPSCPPGYQYGINVRACQLVTVQCGDREVLLSNGTCIIRPECTPGYQLHADGTCRPLHTCPFGFELRPDGHCHPIRPVCPTGYEYRDGMCYFVRQPTVVRPTSPPTSGTTTTCTSDTCTHHSSNTVNVPVTVHTVNNVVLHVYPNGRRVYVTDNDNTTELDGDVSLNNHTTSLEVDVDENTSLEPSEEPPKCCVVVSPRKCTKVDADKWECTQKQTNRCGWFCTRATIYLRPRHTIYRQQTLVMRPPPSWRRYASWNHSPVNGGNHCDCSGCTAGGFACSEECYRYDYCATGDDCEYVDQSVFCQKYAGEGCSVEDGVFE